MSYPWPECSATVLLHYQRGKRVYQFGVSYKERGRINVIVEVEKKWYECEFYF
jgi:hypothetical protein